MSAPPNPPTPPAPPNSATPHTHDGPPNSPHAASPASPALDAETLDPSADPVSGDRPRGRAPAAGGGLTEDGRLRAGRLAGLTMPRAIWVLSWPIMVQSLLNSLVGLTDTVLAAGVSEAATDAIGGASYIVWFIGLVMAAIGVGATALISRAVGGGRIAVANAALGQATLLAVWSGVAVGVIVAAGAGPVAALLNLNEEASRAFRIYMYINAVGAPLAALLLTGIECCRAAGDSLRPLWSMAAVNVVNIVVSWALAGVDFTRTRFIDGEAVTSVVLHNPFPFHLGVTGIAVGTLIGHTVGAAMVLRLLLAGRSGVVLRRRRLRPHWHTMRRLIRVGLPNFFEMLGMWVGNFAIVLMVGALAGAGGGVLGAHIVAIRVEAFSFLPGFAMGTAAAALAGQYLGAGSPRMAWRSTLACTGVASAIMGAMGAVFIFAPRTVVGVLTSQPTHLELVPKVLMVAGFFQVPFAVSLVLRSALRGAGDVKVVMWLTWISTWGIRLPLAYACSGVDLTLPPWLGGGVIDNPFWSTGENGGLVGLWAGLCAELVIRAAMFAARFIQGGWTRAAV